MKSWMFEKVKAAAIVSLLLTFLVSCAPESKNVSSVESQTPELSSSNIIGGSIADLNYQKQNGIVELSISMKDAATGAQGTATCTGSLIAKNIVLTAAHCLADSGITSIAVVFTNDENKATQADVRFASDGAMHPDFLKGVDPKASPAASVWNDIALVKLSEDAPADFKLTRLPSSLDEIKLIANSKVTLAGFGITNSVVRRIVRDKRGVQKIVSLSSVGSGVLRKVDGILVKQVTADKKEILLDQTSQRGACHGDSGGPAFVTAKDGSQIQVGLTSRGTEKLGNCTESAVYTGVAAHLGWIAETSLKLNTVEAKPIVAAVK